MIKRKIDYKHFMLIISIISIVIVVLLGFLFWPKPKSVITPTPIPTLPTTGGEIKPGETEDLSKVQVDVVDTTVFKLDMLNFAFAVVKVRVKSEAPINISLAHFKTDQGIVLNDVEEYVKYLNGNALSIGKQGVVFDSIISKDTSVVTNLFVPIRDKNAKEAKLSIDFGGNSDITLDLSKPKGTKEMLGYVANDIITDGKTYQIQVSEAFAITGEDMFLKWDDGVIEQQYYSSNAEIYAFQIETVSLWQDEIEIESATYTIDGSKSKFDALDYRFYSMKRDNILGKKIKIKEKGTLFFVALNSQENPLTYKGILRLKIKGQEELIEINVDL